ncbi:MAG: hypothetical protein Q9M48_01800 [Rhodobacterales bacterium]|nr:hypothetical protein [Rhodobacterales bacterium]
MAIIPLHASGFGAHRTASTSFQAYMRCNGEGLARDGIGFWGPLRTRGGVLSGVIPILSPVPPKRQLMRARGRILTQLADAQARGFSQLIISDENIIGAPRQNLRAKALYGGIGERLARFHHAFDGRITRVVLSIRSLDNLWASTLAYGVKRGHSMPSQDLLEKIAVGPRTWRDVITDVACAMPDVQIQVMPFETYAGQPEAKLRLMIGGAAKVPLKHHRKWLNRGPDQSQLHEILADRGTSAVDLAQADLAGEGRWQPFNRAQIAQMRENYQDDLHWLRAGADGLALLTEETGLHETRNNLAGGQTIKGQNDDRDEKGRVA